MYKFLVLLKNGETVEVKAVHFLVHNDHIIFEGSDEEGEPMDVAFFMKDQIICITTKFDGNV